MGARSCPRTSHRLAEGRIALLSFVRACSDPPPVIKDENGNVLTESRQILDRWKRYCENMFANTSEPKQTAVDNNESYTDRELEPLRSEVEWAINSLKESRVR